ncbi:MAG TPA: glycosyltransferase [Polyangiaceae bacterium]
MMPPSSIDVTVAVVPREKFSCAPLTLDALLQNGTLPFKLIYVDGNSPDESRRWLRQRLEHRPHTELVRYEHYLGPMQSRNVAIDRVDTKYLMMVDNDVYLQPGCIEALYRCAEEEQAGAVTPLILRGGLDSDNIHVAGGECEVRRNADGKTYFHHRQKWEHSLLSEVGGQLVREPTKLLEDHCIFARTDVLRSLGRLDERLCLMVSSAEFSFLFQKTGAKLLFEPTARAIYLWGPDVPFRLSDLPFWYLVWSEAWSRSQMRDLSRRHNVEMDYGASQTELWWIGYQRRAPLIPFLEANRRRFKRMKLDRLGFFVGKAIEKAEVATSYLISEWALRQKSAHNLPCPSVFSTNKRSVDGRPRPA